ncbi:MAG: type IV secretory system conjugative DNA transfer family protein [Lachnospiraceae bacterium]|jgi:type IV secretion system protein VirD4|nr:type IV secretory system conjugative DNA transfer family protein [Lachnospiraceae bacterium]
MKKKEKLILSVILLAAGTILNLFFTAALHGLMSRQYDTLTLIPFFRCLSGLFTERRQLLLFLSFEGFLALCCMLFWVQNSRSYQSELIEVAGDICTPAPSGQYQHGSSRWLKKEERGRVFETQVIDPRNEIIRMLLDTGYDNLPFLEKESGTKNKEEDTGQEKAGSVPEGRKAAPMTSPSVPINLRREKEDEDFESVEYVVSSADNGRQETGKEALKLPSGREAAEKEKAVGEGDGDKGSDPYKLFPKGGIVVGMEKVGNREKLYLIGDDTHTLTIGATRSGKTRCLVIQSICSIALSGESLAISDPKAELYHYTADYLAKLGYEVICLDFKNPEKSTRYNLLQPVIDAINEDDMERAEMYAWDITNILVGDNTSNEKIWENGEKSTIAAAILCVVADNRKRPEYQNLTNVYWFIAEMSKSVGGKTPMSEYMKKLPAKHPARALMSIAEVAPSRTKGSFDTSALTTLRLFTSRSVYAITHKSDYNIADIGRKKQALFLILPDEKTTYYPIASLMVSQLYELLVRQSDLRGGRLENRVNFVLDEFGVRS